MAENNFMKKSVPGKVSLLSHRRSVHGGEEDYKKRLLKITSLAVLIAVCTSFVAKLIVLLIDLITNISFHGSFSAESSSPADNTLGPLVIAIPAIGGIVVGLMAFYGSKAIRGHGIPEAMEQVLTNKSKIHPIVTILKPISSAISIGTGGPFGAEGPIIATGGSLGSNIGQLLEITSDERKILLAAGAAAGMSAIFGSPIAAIFLAIELLLFEFSPRSIIPVALACIVGAAGHHFFFGVRPIFPMKTFEQPASLTAVSVYAILGMVIGIFSVFVTKIVYFVEDMFEKLPVHWMWWPALGGIVVGVIGLIVPRTLGVGYSNIRDILAGGLTSQILWVLCLLKLTSWAIALGSGTSGGTLAPLFTIGGAAGAVLGGIILQIFPASGITIPLAGLVGMSAMFAGASRAVMTSIIFALETTGQFNSFLPVLASCITAYFVSFMMMENTIMTEKIARRGIKAPHSYEPDALVETRVEQVMKEALVVNEDMTIQELRNQLSDDTEPDEYIVIVDSEKKVKGIVNTSVVSNFQHNSERTVGSLVEVQNFSVRGDESLRTAVEMMTGERVDALSVISKDSKTIGVLSYKDVLSAYKDKFDEKERRHRSISLRRRGLKMVSRARRLMKKTKTSP